MNWAKNHVILKYFLNRELIAELWYKTRVYKVLAAPAIIIKRRNICSHKSVKALTLGIVLATFGLIPPPLWRDWFVFGLFFLLSMIFIFKTPSVRTAANYSIFLYIFVFAALVIPPESSAALLLLGLLAIFGISFLIMNVMDNTSNIYYQILCGIYVSVIIRAIYVSLDTIFAGNLQSEDGFPEFLIMLFPFAFAFAFLKRNKRLRWWLLIGFLPAVYGVAALLFDIGNVVQQQISEIPTDGTLIDAAVTAQGIFSRGGTVGTRPFLDIYNAAIDTFNSQFLIVRLFFYIGMFGILLFLWHIIRLIRRAIVQIFRQKGDARLMLIAGIIALLGAVIIIPFEVEQISVRTLFIYWIVIGIVGGIVKNNQTK